MRLLVPTCWCHSQQLHSGAMRPYEYHWANGAMVTIMMLTFSSSISGRHHRIRALLLLGSYTLFVSPVTALTTTRLKYAASFGFLRPWPIAR